MILKRYFLLLFTFFFALIVQSHILYAQTKTDQILFTEDFFDQTEPLDLVLEFDIKKYMKEKSDSVYLPAKLIFYKDSVKINKEVRIKSRGEFRREKCSFPPFFLNIKGAKIKDETYKGVNKFKIVTHCTNSKAIDYEGLLIREYLTYKIYNIISDYSFKVRLVNIKYIDTSRKNKVKEHKAFIIEPEKILAQRLEAYPLKMDKMKFNLTDSLVTTTMTIFEYMIGNTDYSISGRHNVKLLTFKDFTNSAIITIPYDFDYSGIVDAPYALPRPSLEIESVRDRYFYGLCRSDELYNQVLNLFIDKEEEVFNLLETFEYVNKRDRRYLINYIESFYKEIKKPKFIKYHLRITCE